MLNRKIFPVFTFYFLLLSFITFQKSYSQTDTSLKVLIVIAHPDDESGMAATIYKISHDLHGKVDLALITNGEGGYKYSTLANAYYNLDLTNPAVGRKYLPTIRKQELMNAGKIIGVQTYFFFDQIDDKYDLNVHDPLDTVWDTSWVMHRLSQIMTTTKYNYVFCLLPVPGTHAGHKAATILALKSIASLPASQRPIALGVSDSSLSDTSHTRFNMLAGFPITKIKPGIPQFVFDRTVKFGYKNALSYKIIVNWEIAEHKSQGTMQMYMNQGDYEKFWYFDLNNSSGIASTQQLFERLKIIPYTKINY
jgi:N-acetylglucosamine malate deacetylase 2